MNKNQNLNIFNIPANYDFCNSLFDWLEKKFSKNISEITIFLPNRRSSRFLSQLFSQKKLSPKIRAISDISINDFQDILDKNDLNQIRQELAQIKTLSNIDFLFFLVKEIQKSPAFGKENNFSSAFKIALSLKDLLDEMNRIEIEISDLLKVDDYNLSLHLQKNIEFLKSFVSDVRNHLIKQNLVSQQEYQTLLVNKISKLTEKSSLKKSVIIAGSTGSIISSRRLIKSVANQENGYLILQSLSEEPESFEEENHPQFFLNQLLKFLEISKSEVKHLKNSDFLISDEERQKMLSALMLPALESVRWQDVDSFMNVKEISKDLKNNFEIFEAKNQLREVDFIASALEKNVRENKKCAVITNNHSLVKLLKLRLESMNLNFNDSRDLGILNSKFINFVVLILELIEKDFDSYHLLSLLKNPICDFGKNNEVVEDFEINVIRQERANKGLKGIKQKLDFLESDALNNFFEEFSGSLSSLMNLQKVTNVGSLFSEIILAVEKLSKKTFEEIISLEPEKEELAGFFEDMKSKKDFVINAKNSSSIFKDLASQISFFEKSDSTSLVQILSTVEARLLSYDFLVVASLNEEDFPKIESENWIGKKVKKDLGIDLDLKKIGQSAFDFCNYLSNKSVLMARSLSRNSAHLNQSVFLLKLKIFCKKIDENFSFTKLKTEEFSEAKKVETAIAKPALNLRPKQISITEISTLISNPYDIYAKKILKILPLKKVDFESSYAEFGSFVHKALEEFVKNKSEDDFEKIFKKYFLSNLAKFTWFAKFETIFKSFKEENLQFFDQENYLEAPLKLTLGDVLIVGRIDRIICDKNGFAQIFDYKTGWHPNKNRDIQLSVSALALMVGDSSLKFSKDQITSLNYWKLSSSSMSEIVEIASNNLEVQNLAEQAQTSLKRLFDFFSDEKNGYSFLQNNRSDYSHLARNLSI